jgi:hypothetical protein
MGAGVVLTGRSVPSSARDPLDGESAGFGVDAGVAAIGAGCGLGFLESRDPVKKRSAFHSVFAPVANFCGPCSKRTTKAKVRIASKASWKTKKNKPLMAENRR